MEEVATQDPQTEIEGPMPAKKAKRRGRKPGRKPKAQARPLPEPEPEMEEEEEPTKFVFKSRYARDKLRLKPPTKEPLSDGSVKYTPAEWADFERNTFETTDPEVAAKIRKVLRDIAKRKDRVDIWETTYLDEA